MPDEILDKIRYLCRVIPMVEWSGILLYETTGSIQDPDNMVITLKDIILMNKGSKAYTEYSFNEQKRDQSGYTDRHIDYCEEVEDAIFWQIGHIHSHNNMNVFFSGTDMEELNDNSPCHNFYLSLIVNNRLDFEAKISFVAKAEVEGGAKYVALDANGEEYVIGNTVLKAKKEKLFIYDCSIQSSKETVAPEDFFNRNLREVLEDADRPKFQNSNNTTGNNKSFFPNTQLLKPKEKTYFVDNNQFDDPDPIFVDEDIVEQDIELFALHLLNGTNPPDEETTFDDLLKQFKMLKVSGGDIAKSILDNYFSLYEKFYEDFVGDEAVFIDVTEEMIEFLEIYKDKYRFLTAPIMALKRMLEEFVKQEL